MLPALPGVGEGGLKNPSRSASTTPLLNLMEDLRGQEPTPFPGSPISAAILSFCAYSVYTLPSQSFKVYPSMSACTSRLGSSQRVQPVGSPWSSRDSESRVLFREQLGQLSQGHLGRSLKKATGNCSSLQWQLQDLGQRVAADSKGCQTPNAWT